SDVCSSDLSAWLTRHDRLGEVHRVADVAMLQKVAQRLGYDDRAVLFGLACRGAEVRQGDNLRMVFELVRRKVADVCTEPTSIESFEHSGIIDNTGTREVEHDPARLEQLETRCVDEMTRCIGQWNVHGHDIAARKQIVE